MEKYKTVKVTVFCYTFFGDWTYEVIFNVVWSYFSVPKELICSTPEMFEAY